MYPMYNPSDYPEYQQLRQMSPQPGANSTSVKIMDGMYRDPEGLLGGTMQPERFQEEELIPQPVMPGVDPRMLLKKMKQLQGYGG